MFVWNLGRTVGDPLDYFVAGRLNEDGTGEYFDPRGDPPHEVQVQDFFRRHCPRGVIYNTQTSAQWYQSIGETCIQFLRERTKRHKGFFGFLKELRHVRRQKERLI